MLTPLPKEPALVALTAAAAACLTMGLSPQAPGTIMEVEPSPLASPPLVTPIPPGTFYLPEPPVVGTIYHPHPTPVPSPTPSPTPEPEP